MSAIALRLRDLASGGGLDRAWLASVVIVVLLAVFVPAQAAASVGFAARELLQTAPYLALSIAIAAYAGASGADGQIARVFRGNLGTMIVAAALFGGLSPFCSCGVIPLIAALLTMGVPLAPVMAFWLASPVIDPSMFVLTTGLVSFDFAVAKTLAAIGLGLYGGFATAWLMRRRAFGDPLHEGVGNGGCAGASARTPRDIVWAVWKDAARRARFRTTGIKTTTFLAKWLVLAFLLESLMLAWVPAEWIAAALGGDGLMPLLTATLVGIPAYLNGYAATPLIAGLLHQGMAPGAGLAFLVAGGVTSIPAAIAVFALVRAPVFALYLVFAITGSLGAGLLYQAFAG